MGAAASLRFALIGLDPFLHDWDERFHALVAKNLRDDWLRPVLRANPVLPYDYRVWSTNHVWLHKQPLFLWQIALSLNTFGCNEIALRLPSALLGTLLLWPVYRLGRLIFSPAVGYHAALLLAFAYYQLEMTTGWQSVDHSDVAFLTYVTASLWAYYESQQPGNQGFGWSLAVGIFAGAAVLCKWLPGLVVYAAWGIDVLRHVHRRKQLREYGRLLSAAATTLLVVLPWQLYIHERFPEESAFEQEYAAQHFRRVLEGKGGPWYFYLTQNMWYQYQWLILLLVAGLGLLLTPRMRSRPWGPLLVSCGLVFGFFSVAATKMPSYTYVVAPCLLVIAALAWVEADRWLGQRRSRWAAPGTGALLLLVLTLDLRPVSLLKHHTEWFATPTARLERQGKIRRTAVYRSLNALVPAGYVIFNAPTSEETEAMFYSRRNVYAWWPSETEYRALRQRGLHVATFPDHGQQVRPPYLREPEVFLVPATLD